MKKLTSILSMAALLGMVFAASSFAATLIDSTGATVGGVTFKTSTNVSLAVESTDEHYSAATAHVNGTKAYAALDTSAVITTYDCAAGSTLTASDVSSDTALANSCSGSSSEESSTEEVVEEEVVVES